MGEEANMAAMQLTFEDRVRNEVDESDEEVEKSDEGDNGPSTDCDKENIAVMQFIVGDSDRNEIEQPRVPMNHTARSILFELLAGTAYPELQRLILDALPPSILRILLAVTPECDPAGVFRAFQAIYYSKTCKKCGFFSIRHNVQRNLHVCLYCGNAHISADFSGITLSSPDGTVAFKWLELAKFLSTPAGDSCLSKGRWNCKTEET